MGLKTNKIEMQIENEIKYVLEFLEIFHLRQTTLRKKTPKRWWSWIVRGKTHREIEIH